ERKTGCGHPARRSPSARALHRVAHGMAERAATKARRLVDPDGARLPVRVVQNAPCVSDRARTARFRVAPGEGAPRACPSDDRAARTARCPSDAPRRPTVHARAHQAREVVRARYDTKETVAG